MSSDWKTLLFEQLCKDIPPSRAQKVCEALEEFEKYMKCSLRMQAGFDEYLSDADIRRIISIIEVNPEYRERFHGRRQIVRCGLLRIPSIYNKSISDVFPISNPEYMEKNTFVPENIPIVKNDELFTESETKAEDTQNNQLTENRLDIKISEFSEEPPVEKISFMRMFGRVKGCGVTKEGLLEYLISELGVIADIRTITEKGFEHGLEYRYADDKKAKWPVYSEEIQKNVEKNLNNINNRYCVCEAELQKKECNVNEHCMDEDRQKKQDFLQNVTRKLYDVLERYPDMGLFIEQIQELGELEGIDDSILKDILSKVTWCRVKKKRYYFIERALYSEIEVSEKMYEQTEQYVSNDVLDEETCMKLRDPEALIKELKKRKGI
ncbi:MAG: hypothetical protein MJZ34_12895 [Paludibacteraceae bacterium]|nr:hypothetical protein [Paludibacteraceae bacterium]